MRSLTPLLLVLGVWLLPELAAAQQVPQISLTISDAEGPEQVVPALKILGLLTILALAPAILISMTSFTRIVIVLSFVRQAVGTQNVPPLQVIMALSLLLTAVVMAPVAKQLDQEVLTPYTEHAISDEEAFSLAQGIISQFLLSQTRKNDLVLFYELSGTERPAAAEDVSLHLLVPAFMISELRTGFEMGFLLFLPFVLIDLIVASILTAMGMVMLPPTMISTPLKLLMFVIVDGWGLLTRSLVGSFT
ncbi:MAG: flagellar type III secretion system pore protein FliP [Myxococcales bacterium]|nr:flagellar type III secretion system pore protein FliP [Myxococcales bacterium]